MNPEIIKLYNSYCRTGEDAVTCAILTLADVLTQKSEPDSYTVKEAADRLRLSSKEVYQLCLDGILRGQRSANGTRIPLAEIERYEAQADAEEENY